MTGTGETIDVLHVDDDPAFAELVATFLRSEDERMTVRTAASAAEGLALLEDADVDCVVSDYDMPGQNGIEFLETVREHHPELPFILYTGKGSEEVASEAISAGVTDYLQKGTGSDQYAILANRIGNAVAARRSASEAERRRRRLEETTARLEVLFEDSPDMVNVHDASGSIIDPNAKLCEATGYEHDELTEMKVWELDRALSPAEAADLWDGMAVGDSRRLDGVYERRDGSTFPVEVHVKRLDLEGADRFVAISRDVSERVERERKLEQLRERTQELMYTETIEESTCHAVAAADEIIGAPLSGVHLVNDDGSALEPSAVAESIPDVFEDLPRFERDGVPGSREALAWDVYHSGEPVYIGSLSASDRVTEESPAESVAIHPLGEHGVFIISSRERDAFTDTDRLLAEILANNLEATLDRVAREQTLRTRQNRLRLLHEATRDLIRADSTREVTERIAEAAEEILGFSLTVVRLYDPDEGGLVPVAQTEAVGDIFPEREVFTPADGSLNWEVYESGAVRIIDDIESLDDSVDRGTGLRSLMLLPMGEFGTISVGETVPRALGDTDEFLARILATAGETALQSQEQRADLEARQTELERQNERLEEFASVISHDLRNPLNVASLNLALVAEECDSEYLDGVERAHDRMEALIEDLLTLAREGETPTDLTAVDLDALVESCWQTVDTRDGRLVVETEATVRADEGRLRQLFENLFRNCVEHASTTGRRESADGATNGGTEPSDGGGVTVTVGDVEGGFYVADDGSGIPPDDREQVFEAGYTTREDGTGFGLRIVQQVAESHGWSVQATESEDGGARFEVTGVDFAGE
ncbi:hybrid sensor histidine kinase/response regulator [Haloarchaeobius salinus]|uniref:hybrid sensor histidine kinase/response regulator n=2 Tax=Halobacteriales TaxID=2235 RepID=UPI00210CEB44|nr:response regulator [Haloarchaeobius salinus]